MPYLSTLEEQDSARCRQQQITIINRYISTPTLTVTHTPPHIHACTLVQYMTEVWGRGGKQ